MERRTFVEFRPMGELTRVDPEGLSLEEIARAALRGVEQTHGCLERHIAETKLAHLDATEKRIAMASDLLEVKQDARDTRQDVRDLTLALGVKKPAEGEEKPKATGLATWGPKKVAAAVGGTGISFAVVVKFLDFVGPELTAFLHKAWEFVSTQVGAS